MRPMGTLNFKSVIRGFTLIELLIVVAIIAILAAIAVPNFLEAQTRSKVSRSKADMRSLITAMEAYRVDNNTTPPPLNPSIRSWWGFVPPTLSTPVAYMSSMPNMTFYDKEVIKVWKTFFGGTENNQPYTYVWDVRVINQQRTGVMPIYASADPCVPRNLLGEDATDFFSSINKSSYMVYTSGSDGCDGTVSGGMMTYDATNGTVSYGDIFFYGGGSVEDSGKSTATVPLE